MTVQPIDIHSKPLTDPINADSQNSNMSEDQQEVKLVLALLDQGKQAKTDVVKDWDKRWDFYCGTQWDQGRPAYKSSPVYNIIRSSIQAILPILTDAHPGFNVIPEEPADYSFADTLSKLTESWWDKSSLDHTLIEIIMDSFIYDAGIAKITWDPDLQDGIGDVKMDCVDPRDIYIPPQARDFDKDCPFVVHLTKKSVGELKIKFPDKASLIKPDADTKTQEENKSQNKTDVTLISPIDKKSSISNSMPSSGGDDRSLATVAECWIEDNTLEEYQEENEIKFKKRYPRGKVITILPFQRVLLQSVENPYKHGKKPFVRFVDTILPRKFWGQGEVQDLMGIQRIINKTLSIIIDYMNFMGNPVWKIGKGSGVDPNKVTNQIGLVLEINDGKLNDVQREIPPPLPQYIISFYDMMIRAGETVSGASEITQGRKPSGVTAGSAIETVQEAAQTRIRLKERNLQVSLSQCGRMVIALMMQYYTQPRVARLTGTDVWPEFFEFFVEDLPEESKIKYTKKGYKFDEAQNRYIEGETTQGISKGIFDVKILSGTALPFAKAQRSNIAFRLFDSKVIDPEELLKTLEWPDKEQVLKRLQDAQMQQQGAQNATA